MTTEPLDACMVKRYTLYARWRKHIMLKVITFFVITMSCSGFATYFLITGEYIACAIHWVLCVFCGLVLAAWIHRGRLYP